MSKIQASNWPSILFLFLFTLRPCLADSNPFPPDDYDPFGGPPYVNDFRPMRPAQAMQPRRANGPGEGGSGQGLRGTHDRDFDYTPVPDGLVLSTGDYGTLPTGVGGMPMDSPDAYMTGGYIRRGPPSVTTIPGATTTTNFAQEVYYSSEVPGEVEAAYTGTAAAFGASPTGYPREFICPNDNGATFSTGGKCFELHCNSATALNVGVAEEFPSTSLKQCAEACGRNNQCVACDIHGQGARNPGKCLLFRGTPTNGKLTVARDIHYWVMLNSNQCGNNRDQYPDDRDSPNSYGIDPQVVRSASDACDRQYNGARPTPLFNERGRPVCCGPVKNYDRYGQVVESCPPSRNNNQNDDDVGMQQNLYDGSGGDGSEGNDGSGGKPRRN